MMRLQFWKIWGEWNTVLPLFHLDRSCMLIVETFRSLWNTDQNCSRNHHNCWMSIPKTKKKKAQTNIQLIQRSVVVLCFDLLTRPKMPFKVMHRKEVIHSNGCYERKSRGRKLADEMGRAKKKITWYNTEWYTGREWPLNCMTVISAWWRLNIRFQRSSGRRTII